VQLRILQKEAGTCVTCVSDVMCIPLFKHDSLYICGRMDVCMFISAGY